MNLPPEPSSSHNYRLWRKEIEIWKKLTDLPKVKMGAALQYACRTNKNINRAVLEIPEEDVDCDEGLDNVLTVLDQLHNVDKVKNAVMYYEEFEALKRKEDQTVQDFVRQFESLAAKNTANGNTFSDQILADKLMRTINLPHIDKLIIRATVKSFTVKEIKEVLTKMYRGSTSEVKVEATYYSSEAAGRGKEKKEGHQQFKNEVHNASTKLRNNFKYNYKLMMI